MKRPFKYLVAGAVASALAVAPMAAVSAAPAELPDESIAELAVANDLDILVAAVTAAGLAENLADCSFGPVTVFAPTDAAFAAALEALDLTAEELLGNTELLTDVLLYHVVSGIVPASEVVAATSLPTLQGGDISVDGTVLNGSVNIVATDVFACNGVVHVIDGVLLPAGDPEPEPEPTTPPTVPAPTQPVQPPATSPTGELPATGTSTNIGVLAAVALLFGGAALVGVTRRRVDA